MSLAVPSVLQSATQTANPFRFMRRKYALAVFLLFILALSNYLILHHLADTQTSSAITINISGRQRMLSQRIALLSMQMATATDATDRARLRADLLGAVNQMGVTHMLLTEANGGISGDVPLSPALQALYFDPPNALNTQVQQYLTLAAQIALLPDDQLTLNNPVIASLLTSAPTVLNSFNDAVSIYQVESERQVDDVKQLTLVFFSITLLVLGLETLLIFRPMRLRIQAEAKQLQAEVAIRREAENHIRQSKARYQAVIDGQTEAICRYLPDGTLTFVNDTYCQWFNKPREALLGSNLFDLVSTQDAQQHIHRVIDNTRAEIYEHTSLTHEGKTRWEEWNDSPVLDEDGQIIEFQAVGRDRTELKQMELSLRETEERYRLLVRNMADVAIIMYDADLRFTLVDGPFIRRAGYIPEAMTGHTLAEVIPNAELRATLEPMYQAALRGEEIEYERDRGDFVYHSHFLPVRNVDGVIVGGMVVSEDITERKRAEEALQESEERLRQLAEHIQQSLWMIDTDTFQMIYISPAYETIWGLSKQSMYENSASFIDAIHPNDRDNFIKAWTEGITTGLRDLEYRIIRPDGIVRWISTSGYPIHDAQGKLCRMVGVSEDVTQRKEMEQKAFNLTLNQEKSRLWADFIRDTSRELQAPLATMTSNLYLLRKTTNPIQRTQQISEVEQQIHFIDDLIGELHKMADQDATPQPKLAEVDVNGMVRKVCVAMAPQMAQKEHRLIINGEANLPLIRADADQLQSAFTQLLDNAIVYTPEGGTITVSTAQTENDITISVQDTGIGIDSHDLEHIFERFYKAKRSRLSSSGPGLGLAMVHKNVQLQNGSVEVESVPGKGSTFRLRMPVVRESVFA